MNKFFELGLFGAAGAAAFTAAFVTAIPADTNAPTAVNAAVANDPATTLATGLIRQNVAEYVKDSLASCLSTDSASAIAAPGTPPEQIKKILDRIDSGYYGEVPSASRAQPVDRWFNGSNPQGDPVTLTYSFPPDGIAVGGGGEQNSIFATLDGIYGSTAVWEQIFRDEFDRWSATTGVTYTQVSDDGATWLGNAPGQFDGGSGRGDIRIVMGPLDGGGGTLAFNSFPNDGDMFMDEDEFWGNSTFFRNVITHEHGHGQGLAHVCPANGTKLMEPFINTGFLGPQLDDRIAVQILYGDRFEPNQSGASSVDLPGMGLTTTGSPLVVEDVSIDVGSDEDLYRVESFGGTTLSFTVLPIGLSYPEGDQDAQCTSDRTFDSEAVADLRARILDPVFNVVETIDLTGAGDFETISNFELDQAGDYFISVSSNNNFPSNDAQLYRLTVSTTGGGGPANPGDLTGDGCVSSADLGVILSAWGSTSSPSVDLDNDGVVGSGDLGIILSGWTGFPCN